MQSSKNKKSILCEFKYMLSKQSLILFVLILSFSKLKAQGYNVTSYQKINKTNGGLL